MKLVLPLIATLTAFPLSAQANDFSITFDWSDLKKCTSGMPKTVKNPTFSLQNVPDGTTWIHFKLTDLNVPGYNHGGGWVEYKGQSIIEPGAFDYKSPCPPNGQHEYRWTVSAKSKKSSFGGTIGQAKASKIYP